MSDLAIWAIIGAAALWAFGLPFVAWRMVRSGAMERSQAKAEARARARQSRPMPAWVGWLVAFWLGHFLNSIVFMAVGYGIRAAGVDVTTGAAAWVFVTLFLVSWITTSVLLRRSWSGDDRPSQDQRAQTTNG